MDKADAIAQLRKELPVGTTVYTVLRHVSKSGMSRSISLVMPTSGGIRNLDYLAVAAGLGKFDRDRGGIKVGGTGMDMGFSLVYSLSRLVYPDGHRCTGQGYGGKRPCPSNDHSNDREPNYRRGRKHSDGGYALHQSWL